MHILEYNCISLVQILMSSLGWITPSLMLYEHDTLNDLVSEVFLVSNIKQFPHICIQLSDLWDMQVERSTWIALAYLGDLPRTLLNAILWVVNDWNCKYFSKLAYKIQLFYRLLNIHIKYHWAYISCYYIAKVTLGEDRWM